MASAYEVLTFVMLRVNDLECEYGLGNRPQPEKWWHYFDEVRRVIKEVRDNEDQVIGRG